MTSPIISLENLTKDYGNGRGIFDVSLNVFPGESLGFLGANGAGKTVTMRLLMGFISPSCGNATLFGLPCFEKRAEIQQHVGYLPGELACPDDMTAESFIAYIGQLKRLKNLDRAHELMEYFEVVPHVKLRRLSKGNKQKVGIVAAFMGKPDLLLLDEPTSGLDLLMQQRFTQLVQAERARGATILLSSHLLEEVEGICDRAVFIRKGRLIGEEVSKDLSLESVLSYLYGKESISRKWEG